jgi:glycosyltransferase involved in cell wall biosynthesis
MIRVIIPAHNEAERIASTVRSALQIDDVALVLVVDDGSTDATRRTAEDAGATVIRLATSGGKGAAMQRGALAASQGKPPAESDIFVFLDADLEDSARNAGDLVRPILEGQAELVIGNLPAQKTEGGGTGRVVRLARDGVREATQVKQQQPLSGQRALTSQALLAALPFETGFGVEVGMTIDLLRLGFRVVEVPVDFFHRVTGSDLASQRHRAKQYISVWRALRSRGVGPRIPFVDAGS